MYLGLFLCGFIALASLTYKEECVRLLTHHCKGRVTHMKISFSYAWMQGESIWARGYEGRGFTSRSAEMRGRMKAADALCHKLLYCDSVADSKRPRKYKAHEETQP